MQGRLMVGSRLISYVLRTCCAAGVLPVAVSADTFDFRIDFSEQAPYQQIKHSANVVLEEVWAERADGTIDPVDYNRVSGIFSVSDGEPQAFVESSGGWQAQSQAAAKAYVFTVRATGPYEAIKVREMDFLLHRTIASGHSFWGIGIGEENVAAGVLPPGEDVAVSETFTSDATGTVLKVRIQAWDEVTGAEVYLAAIRGTGQIVKVPVEADSTIHAQKHHAYMANAGWVNLRPSAETGVVAGEFFLSGYAWSANLGWIDFGGGTPANGWRYGNDSAEDFGVNLIAHGELSGFAWGTNIGWIHFGWADADDPNRPRIDLRTGQFQGYAWSPNVGWLNLQADDLVTDTLAVLDSKDDGIPDAWKYKYFGGLDAAGGPEADSTGDGHTNLAHYLAGTDPTRVGKPIRIVDFTIVPAQEDLLAEVTFTSNPGRLYRIATSQDLKVWEQPGELLVPGASDTTTGWLPFSSDDARRFFRVVPVRPLSL